jgi:hypothetical protein
VQSIHNLGKNTACYLLLLSGTVACFGENSDEDEDGASLDWEDVDDERYNDNVSGRAEDPDTESEMPCIACPYDGAIECAAGELWTCVEAPDGCVSWNEPEPCADGFCASDTECGVCENTCDTESEQICSGIHLWECLADENGCLSWVAKQCPGGFCTDVETCALFVDEEPTLSDEIGVFVSPTGLDANPGTMAAPVRTMTKGIEVAESVDKIVVVSQGSFAEPGLEISVPVFGGYDPSNWTPGSGVSAIANYDVSMSGQNAFVRGFSFVFDSGRDISTLEDASAVLINNSIDLTRYSGIRVHNNASLTMVNNIIHFSDVGRPDAIITNVDSKIHLLNNTIYVPNISRGFVGVSLGGLGVFVNNVFSINSEDEDSRGILFKDGGNAELFSNNFEPNLACPVYLEPTNDCVSTELINACTWAGCLGAGGNTQLVSGIQIAENGHALLSQESALIDRGRDPSAWSDVAAYGTDFEGDQRPAGGNWDIGADEFVP